MKEAKLIVLDPGHFHASLVQSEMYPGLSKQVSVYAPLGPDVLDYLNRVSLFNARKESPTSWEIEVHTGPDFFQRMLREKPGNVVIMTGRNRPKIDRLTASVDAGLNASRRQAMDHQIGRYAEARARAGRGREEGVGRLRHHDRAIRDHVDSAARTGE